MESLLGIPYKESQYKTMNLLFMSIALAVVVSGVVWLVFKFLMWMQGREGKQIKKQ